MWQRVVGSARAAFALRADYQAQLKRVRDELGFQSVRFHGILSDDVGVVVREGRDTTTSFYNVFRIWDYLLSIGVRPFVELSFMPELLASGKATVFRYRGNVTPPRDYARWSWLIRQLARAAVERYGADEVAEWYFEVWNEPNLRAFWRGSQSDYFRLYRESALALKSVDARLRVGGPATAKNQWLKEFLEYCERNQAPVEFVSTHHYPTDLPSPTPPSTEEVLAGMSRDVLRHQAQDARRKAGERPLFFTEWNSSSSERDPLHDDPYAAAFAARVAIDAAGIVDVYAFWTFSDLFEESFQSSLPFHGGFGLLTIHGIPKPVYRAFELLRQLPDEMVAVVDGIHETVEARAFRDGSSLTILLTNFAMPRQPIGTERVTLLVDHAQAPSSVTTTSIDDGHANPKNKWLEMGAPTYPTDNQIADLESASKLEAVPAEWQMSGATLSVEILLRRYAVTAVRVAW